MKAGELVHAGVLLSQQARVARRPRPPRVVELVGRAGAFELVAAEPIEGLAETKLGSAEQLRDRLLLGARAGHGHPDVSPHADEAPLR